MRCEVVIPRSTGTPLSVPFEVPDGASDADIRAAAERAVQERYASQGLVNRDVNYDIYLDTNPASPGARGAGDQMLLIRGGNLVREAARATRPAGTSPLTYHVQWARDQILRATVLNNAQLDTDPTRDGIQTMPGLEGLSYVSDGQTGPLSQEEARSFLRRFEMLFTNDPAGRAQLQFVYSQNPQFDFGPDGNFRLADIYTAANVAPPGSITRPETGGANDPLNPQAGSTDDVANQIVNNSLDLSGLDAQDRITMSRIRGLVAVMLMGGDPEILLPIILSQFRMLSKTGQARAGYFISRVLENTQNTINQNAQRIAQLQSNQGATGRTQQQAGSDQGEITRLTTSNQILMSSLQSFRPLLESFQAEAQEISTLADTVMRHRQAMAQKAG